MQDIVAALLTAGANVALSYNDAAGTLSVTASAPVTDTITNATGDAKAWVTSEGDIELLPKPGQKIRLFPDYRLTAESSDAHETLTLRDATTGTYRNFRVGNLYFGDSTTPFTGETAGGLWSAVDIVPITGAETLTSAAIGKLHLCTGTSTDYTVTLPSAATCAGGVIQFQMSGALTKLVTLSSAQLIDGLANRVMWAGESAALWSDGATWSKIAGRSLPMRFEVNRNGDNQTDITTDTEKKILFNSVIQNGAGLFNTTSLRWTNARPGMYFVAISALYLATASNQKVCLYLRHYGTGATVFAGYDMPQIVSFQNHINATIFNTSAFAATDTFEATIYAASQSGSGIIDGRAAYTSWLVCEAPTW